jgi:hypothetical protein
MPMPPPSETAAASSARAMYVIGAWTTTGLAFLFGRLAGHAVLTAVILAVIGLMLLYQRIRAV